MSISKIILNIHLLQEQVLLHFLGSIIISLEAVTDYDSK